MAKSGEGGRLAAANSRSRPLRAAQINASLAALIIEIARINFWNRTTVAVRQAAGSG